jgi:hypothetical protein
MPGCGCGKMIKIPVQTNQTTQTKIFNKTYRGRNQSNYAKSGTYRLIWKCR